MTTMNCACLLLLLTANVNAVGFLKATAKHAMAQDPAEKNVYGAAKIGCGDSANCGVDPPAIHAMCLTSLPANFCTETGQAAGPDDWCKPEAGTHHCVCLGAWSMYVAKGDTAPGLDCNAVPGSVMSDDYIQNWKTWNGNELAGQEANGLQALFTACNTGPKADTFKTTFCAFVSGSKILSPSEKEKISGSNCGATAAADGADLSQEHEDHEDAQAEHEEAQADAQAEHEDAQDAAADKEADEKEDR